jgi:diacylglycerol O-acyltransferase / wax synthase
MASHTSGPVQYDDHMGEMDALMWNIERDPMLRSTILSVMVLDRPPDEARWHAALARALRKVPRLSQRVSLDPLGAAPPQWEHDPNFDLGYHLRRVRAPGRGTFRDLLDVAAPMVMQAFDKDRPLWELVQVDDLTDGQTGILLKVHHSVSDGVGLVRMTASLVERAREPHPSHAGAPHALLDEPLPTAAHGAFRDALEALRYRAGSNLEHTARAANAIGGWLARATRHPVDAADEIRQLAGSLGRLLEPIDAPLSPVMGGRSLGLHLDALTIPLAELQRAARSARCTLNDAFVAGVTGGLRRYHEAHQHPVEALRMTMPINLRSGDDATHAGNHFSAARFLVPVALRDPGERMQAIHALVTAQRHEPALPLVDEVAALIGRLPRMVAVGWFGSMLKAIDFVTSNVPGPQFPVYASGARVLRMFGFGPLTGAAANITLFSYDGDLDIGISTDRAAVPDPAVFRECLSQGMAEVLGVG